MCKYAFIAKNSKLFLCGKLTGFTSWVSLSLVLPIEIIDS